jgi:hypothetical protein
MEVNGSKNGRSVSGRSKKGHGGAGRGKPSLLAETRQLIEILKESKIEHYKSESLEIKFSMLAFLPKEPEAPKSVQTTDEDELLFYSAPARS